MSEPNLDLDYTITIKGRIPCKDLAAQQECIDAANLMDHAIPSLLTRTSSNIELTSADGQCLIQIDKNTL